LTSQSDYEEQYKLQDKTPLTFFHYQNKLKVETKQPRRSTATNEKPIYYVKIPIINPKNLGNLQQYSINMNFFFKSLRHQDYWIKKGTEIYLDIIF